MGQTVIAFPTIGVLENELGQVGLLWFQSLTISFLSIVFHLIMCAYLSVCLSVCLFIYRSVYLLRQDRTKQRQDKTRQDKAKRRLGNEAGIKNSQKCTSREREFCPWVTVEVPFFKPSSHPHKKEGGGAFISFLISHGTWWSLHRNLYMFSI